MQFQCLHVSFTVMHVDFSLNQLCRRRSVTSETHDDGQMFIGWFVVIQLLSLFVLRYQSIHHKQEVTSE